MVVAAVVATSAVRDWSFMAVDWSWAGVDYHIDTSTTNLDKIEAGHISVATLLSNRFAPTSHVRCHPIAMPSQCVGPAPPTAVRYVGGPLRTTTVVSGCADVCRRRLSRRTYAPTERDFGIVAGDGSLPTLCTY
jgi:hypothetical protein